MGTAGDARGWGLVVGPLAFIAAWVAAGARMPPDYSPLTDAISRTASVGAEPRGLMTVGFVTYAAAVGVGALALRRALPGPAWLAAVANAAATLGVALTPLDRSASVDALHGVAAGAGYAALALTPLLAARPLATAGHHRAALASRAMGVAIGACLAATVPFDGASGGLQRLGLTVGDIWLIVAGVALARGSRLSGRAACT